MANPIPGKTMKTNYSNDSNEFREFLQNIHQNLKRKYKSIDIETFIEQAVLELKKLEKEKNKY